MAEAIKLFEGLQAKPDEAGAVSLAKTISAVSGADLAAAGFFEAIEKAATAGKKKETHREAAAYVFAALSDADNLLEPYLLPIFPTILELSGDKTRPVALAGKQAITAFVARAGKTPATAFETIQRLLKGFDTTKFQIKIAALESIGSFAKSSPKAVICAMPALVPEISDLLHDTKVQVSEEAEQALRAIADTVVNKDIVEFIPELVKSLIEPTNVPDCVHKLSGTKFVATVERPELTLITPLLVRGFRESDKRIVRQCAKIADNLSKLVEVPSEAEPLLPKLTPALEIASENTADPECREVCAKVTKQLARLKSVIDQLKAAQLDREKFLAILKEDKRVKSKDPITLAFVAAQLEANFEMKLLDVAEWEKVLKAVSEDFSGIAKDIFAKCEDTMRGTVRDEEEDSAELCNCKFTLAYGSKILLKNTQLRLLRGYKYGLLGANDCGKTSLLKAIANDQVEGFPPSTEVRTVFVEADILGELSHLTCIEYIMANERIQAAGISAEQIEVQLSKVGFAGANELAGGKAARTHDPVSSLSGGWRMKLALARAMLQKADILLMDDPTNHLDVKNVAWVIDYIKGLKDVTCLIVSCNPALLQDCTQRLIYFDNLKLLNFKGTIKEFVDEFPEAKSFFELKSTKGLSFKFPDPGFLEGVTSRGKILIKMDKVDFTYPGNPKPTVVDLSVRVSMASRVACLGPNGAGKSTMIKLLTGELEPQTGTQWKHPNAKVAYVAQHAFHHIESHLTKTPVEYILWRYEYGTDKEALNKVTMVLTEEEEKKLKEVRTWEFTDDEGLKRQKCTIEKLTGVRKSGKRGGYTYEVRFSIKGFPEGKGPTGFVTEDKLNEGGWSKHVKQAAEKILAEEGRFKRPLTQANVEKLLMDVGLEREYCTHTQMNSLSGGQKVKVVLGAAMWDQPHIVILDEPTNYLDRESLAALAGAITEYKGGVVIITHNDQFSKALCPETWLLEKGDDGIGRLDCQGDADWMEAVMKEKTNAEVMEEMVDALGNVTKVKAPKKKELTRKERKARELAKKKALELGEHWSSSEDDA